jgi:hypothetical protein
VRELLATLEQLASQACSILLTRRHPLVMESSVGQRVFLMRGGLRTNALPA